MEVYKISKLHKFMTTINFIMQDSIRFLVLNSLSDFTRLFSQITNQKVVINGASDVVITDLKGSSDNVKKPLFQVDLVFRNGTVAYGTDISVYESILLSLFDKAISVVEGLPQLEPLILDQMFWSTKPEIQTPHQQEPVTLSYRQKFRQVIKQGLAPLEEYLKQYEKYHELLNLDVTKFAKEYDAKNLSSHEIEVDYIKYLQEWELIDKDVPSHVNLGLFHVSCDSIRTAMKKDLAKVAIESLSRRAGKLSSIVTNNFSLIQQRLKEKPSKIEELTELREYMKTIPAIVKAQEAELQDMLHNYDLLEKYKIELPNEDFKARWNAFSWPIKIEEMVESSKLALDVDHGNFMKNLSTDQELFTERLDNLSVVINDFSKNIDMANVAEVVAEVHKVAFDLKECQNLSVLFNSRERLFNLDVTHYEQVFYFAFNQSRCNNSPKNSSHTRVYG
jgi:dynein heavy chain